MTITLLVLIGGWWLWTRRTEGLRAYDLPVAWAVKMLVSCLFIYIYTYYYGSGTLTADPEAFMQESRLLRSVADISFTDYLRFLAGMESPEMVTYYLSETTHWSSGDLTLINDSKNVIRVNSLLLFVSGGSVYFHAFFLGLLSLMGFREVFQTFRARIQLPPRLFWWLLILMPSLIFWTGSMLKEPLLMVGLCLMIRAWLGELTVTQRIWRWGLGIVLMLAFKPYVLLCLLPALAVYYSAKWFFRSRVIWSILTFLVLLVSLLVLLPQQRNKAVHYLTRKQFDFINIGQGGLHAYADTCFFYFRPDQFHSLEIHAADSSVWLKEPVKAKQVLFGKAHPFKDVWLQPNDKRWIVYFQSKGCASHIDVTPINNSFRQLLLSAPKAFVNAAFRPFFGDPGGWLKYFAITETLLLLGVVVYCFRKWKKAGRDARLQVVSLLIFAVVLLLLIGWITPVLGAIVRYRIPAYFALLIAALLLYKKKETKHE